MVKATELNWARILELKPNNTILFRVDASEQIGSGHVMRCLTLAEELRGSCDEIIFICRELPGNLIEHIEAQGFRVFRVPPEPETGAADVEQTKKVLRNHGLQPDWLIVDKYGLDKHWESALRPLVKRIMVIDDLADREHDCDLLLDQNYYRNLEIRYRGLVPNHCRQLLGPKYALLRQEFKTARRSLRVRDGSVKGILIFYGGSDPTDETTKALEAIRLLNRPDLTFAVVVGASNPRRESIQELCLAMANTKFYCQADNMAELMARADLALGAGGASNWERCYLGLPALITIVAENQRETVEALAEAGIVWNLGWHAEVGAVELVESLKALMNNPDRIREMSQRGLALFEG